ncbi:CPK2 [Symbiodinium natans]|uniref:non-specific serine/threonine protein kinase n=1 Tax=Symbiodinium natans TaxID=878477 RepID=A0A812J9T1_9DINO|nr:CPK2 [Symbiodinium natans]
MGTSLASACARVEQPAPTGDHSEDLQAFDRALLAQVKKGKLEDNYEMLEELGSGSFGVVNRARDIRTKCLSMATFVAVKTIPKKKISDPKTIKDEFNVLRQLDHAHICKAYECYEDRRHIYLVMDICAGGTLLESLCVQQRFPEPHAAKIMRQTLSALSYLHQANFIFRDLKTENIMFATPVHDGEVGNIKLIDFGLCCPYRPGAKITRAAGTPYSVAPELVTAPVQYDQRCDSWSAGVVMFIILSGQYPFHGKTKEELLHKIRKEPVSFKSARWKKISKEGKSVLVELLRKKPENRCSVADALRHEWLKVQVEMPSAQIMEGIVNTMIQFQSLNLMQKAALTALAWRASDEDTQHLRQIFECLDRDGNGHMTIGELRGAFAEVGVTLPGGLSLCGVGTDGNDTIEYTEFLAAALDKKKVLKEDVVWEAFKIFDADGSGTVTKAELCKLLTSGRTSDKSKQEKESKAIEAFLDSYDTSGDGVVDFDEFMGMLDESHTKSQSKQVSTTTNLESAEPSAKNSYFGFFCSNLSGAAGEKEQVTPSVSSRQQNRQTVRRSTAAGKESEACQAILGGSWYLLTNDNLYFLLYL